MVVVEVGFQHLEENKVNNFPHWVVVDYSTDMDYCKMMMMMMEDPLDKVVDLMVVRWDKVVDLMVVHWDKVTALMMVVHLDKASIGCFVEPLN